MPRANEQTALAFERSTKMQANVGNCADGAVGAVDVDLPAKKGKDAMQSSCRMWTILLAEFRLGGRCREEGEIGRRRWFITATFPCVCIHINAYACICQA